MYNKEKGRSVQDSLVANSHDSTASTKAVVEAAKVDGSDAELAQRRGTHDAWFHRNVQVGILQHRGRVLGENLAQGHKLCVASSLLGRNRSEGPYRHSI